MRTLANLSSLLPMPAFAVGPGGGGHSKLVAVAALSLDELSEISVHAAHAPNFVLFDDHGKFQGVMANPYMNLHDETAAKVADLLAEKNVRLMIAGEFGPRLAEALDAKGIAHIQDMGLANIAVSAHRDRL